MCFSNIKKLVVDQGLLDIESKIFIENDVIIIRSSTGSGKTKIVAKVANDLIKSNPDHRILSLVNLISLAHQQITEFNEQKIVLANYQKSVANFGVDNGVICINSLAKLKYVKHFDMKKIILYIDECNDLIDTLCQNETLNKVLVETYDFLMKLIKNCAKIIITDATINQNTYNLIGRRLKTETMEITNISKKFNGISAYCYNDEEKFINKLRDCIKNKKYFLFGCDSCNMITLLHKKFIDEFPEQKDKFLLVTSDTKKYKSSQFVSRYTMYSPSIITGVSFWDKVPQSQFLYITDNPKISPISLMQMSSRTRNMESLHIYIGDVKNQPVKFDSLEALTAKYEKNIICNNMLNKLSMSRNEDDEIVAVRNTFFKIYCYSEYEKMIFKSDYINHFIRQIDSCGFKIENIGIKKKLEKIEKDIDKQVLKEMKEEIFEDYIECNKFENESDFIELKEKYPNFHNRASLLGIHEIKDLLKYKEHITNQYYLEDYFRMLNLFKTEDEIRLKLEGCVSKSYDSKAIKSVYNKILMVFQFEKHYNINRFNFDFDNVKTDKVISKDFQTLLIELFDNIKDAKYTTNEELLEIYLSMIKKISGSKMKLVKRYQKCVIKGKKIYGKIISEEVLQFQFELCQHRNPKLNKFNIELLNNYKIKPDLTKAKYLDDVDNDDLELYLYNTTFNKK